MAIRLSPNARRLLNTIKLNRFLVIVIILIMCFVIYLLLPGHTTESAEQDEKMDFLDKLKIPDGKREAKPAVTFDEKDFFINGKMTRILSGSIHYFRVVPDYWLDRLQKLKAMGLNTVET